MRQEVSTRSWAGWFEADVKAKAAKRKARPMGFGAGEVERHWVIGKHEPVEFRRPK